MHGVFRAGKDIHDYKVPNNPDNNEWHNLALEDMESSGIYLIGMRQNITTSTL